MAESPAKMAKVEGVPFKYETKWNPGLQNEYILPLKQKPGLIIQTDKKTLALCDTNKLEVLYSLRIPFVDDEDDAQNVEALSEAGNHRFITGHQDGTLCLWQIEYSTVCLSFLASTPTLHNFLTSSLETFDHWALVDLPKQARRDKFHRCPPRRSLWCRTRVPGSPLGPSRLLLGLL
jgi:hypothetical protein